MQQYLTLCFPFCKPKIEGSIFYKLLTKRLKLSGSDVESCQMSHDVHFIQSDFLLDSDFLQIASSESLTSELGYCLVFLMYKAPSEGFS